MVKKKSKLTRSAEFIARHESLLVCPICASPLTVHELKSLICENRHTFDIAKQGYLNLLNQTNKTHYDQALFTARRQVLANSPFFEPFTTQLTELIYQQTRDKKAPTLIDMGSGEGTHLAQITNCLTTVYHQAPVGIGIDIAREGVLEAARHYDHNIWVIADLARTPLADQVADVIINILSPSNYEEFSRVLSTDGVIIKVVPRSHYLQELRNAFYHDSEQEVYSNTKIIEHFKNHFDLLTQEQVTYTTPVDAPTLSALVKMTPLTWHVPEQQVDDFTASGQTEITVDLDILVGKRK